MSTDAQWKADVKTHRERLDVLYAYERVKRGDFLDLNRQGVWMFVASVGCWSLPIGLIRYAGLGFVFAAFVYELFVSVDQTRMDQNYAMREAVDSAIRDDVIAREHYDRIQNNLFGKFGMLKHAWLYWASFGGWGFSLIYSLTQR